MKAWNKICGILFVFLLTALFSIAQTNKNFTSHSSLLSKTTPFTGNNSLLFFPVEKKFFAAPSIKIINQDYYPQHFGFFCKKELALEKVTKIPLRIRLGSLQQCNYLEGKK